MNRSPDIDILDTVLGFAKEAGQVVSSAGPELKQTQRREVELWRHWNTNGRKPEHLQPLFESFKPVIEKHARVFTNRVELPTSAIHSELNKHFVNAMKSFDPKRGVQLNTWVQTNLQKTSRFVKMYQNLGKIPEAQISKIREFNQAKEHLQNKLGFEPDTSSLADHLRWPLKRVAQLQRELSRKDLPASAFAMDPAEHLHPRELEAIKLMQYDLGPQERTVYEYTFGVNGRPMLSPGQIATKVGIHASKVSRIRNQLQDQFRETLKVVS